MFFIVIPVIIGLINFYLFRTAARGFPEAAAFIGFSLALLYLSLFAAIFLERADKTKVSLPFSWIGYSWLGVSGLALVLAAITDAAQLLLPAFDDRSQAIVVGLATAVLSIWAAISAQQFRIVRIHLVSPKLRDASKTLTIVQITDLHLGDSSTLARTRRIVESINGLQPDVIVSTGDLFDGYLELMAPYVELLKQLEAPMGKFAVSGNHEFYAGLEEALGLTESAGFTILRGAAIDLDAPVTLVGVDDLAFAAASTEVAALEQARSDRFTILLKHRPAVERSSIGKFDLQLSGHTHGGQIAPFHLLTKLAFKAKPGLSTIAKNQWLYLSRGTGSWGPQMRLLSPCEISVVTLGAEHV